MSDEGLAEIAASVLGLDDLGGDAEALGLLPMVHGAVWPGIRALGELELATLPPEPDLDPARPPRAPIA